VGVVKNLKKLFLLCLSEKLLEIALSIMPDCEEKIELARFLYEYSSKKLEKPPWPT
jgi:hypothetical protein